MRNLLIFKNYSRYCTSQNCASDNNKKPFALVSINNADTIMVLKPLSSPKPDYQTFSEVVHTLSNSFRANKDMVINST